MQAASLVVNEVQPATVVVPAEDSEQKTVLVLGAYRGGTSMVSCVLHHLGVPMGEDRLRDGSWEDPTIRELVYLRDFRALSDVILQRNQQLIWGWKDPATIDVMDDVLPLVRHPHLILVLRDVAAVYQRERAVGTQSVESLWEYVTSQHQRLMSFLMSSPHPLLVVSYERAIRDPVAFVSNVISFLSLSTSPELVLQALQTVQPGVYYKT